MIDFLCHLPNNSKKKQEKATEVYLFQIFCKKNITKLLVINTERKL